MRNLYKLVLAGFVAFGTSCSNDDSSVAGATTEPNTLQIVKLSEEQNAVLARAINTIMGTSNETLDTSAAVFSALDMFFSGWTQQIFSYPSKDRRRICDVVTFSDSYSEFKDGGVFRAMAYDEEIRTCPVYDSLSRETVLRPCSTDVYMRNHHMQTAVGIKIIEVDSVPVVLETLNGYNAFGEPYWGYGVTCSETLKNFKQSCRKSNGLFKDFADGCRDSELRLACASFAPNGVSTDALFGSYIQEYRNECIADSIKYAPFDDENYIPYDRYTDSLFLSDTVENWRVANRWTRELKQSLNAYRWQFSISNVNFDEDGGIYDYKENTSPELWYLSSLYSYNTLSSSEIADAYRKEGAYVLPDSLVAQFFPLAASVPFGLRYASGEQFGSKKTDIFYMIVVKDVGTKGHILSGSDADGIYVTDIVKSGESCPIDTTVHYSAFLVVNTPEWDVLEKPIVKKTFVSENWNCDKPETLEKIEPYGEWAFPGINGYINYVELDLYE